MTKTTKSLRLAPSPAPACSRVPRAPPGTCDGAGGRALRALRPGANGRAPREAPMRKKYSQRMLLHSTSVSDTRCDLSHSACYRLSATPFPFSAWSSSIIAISAAAVASRECEPRMPLSWVAFRVFSMPSRFTPERLTPAFDRGHSERQSAGIIREAVEESKRQGREGGVLRAPFAVSLRWMTCSMPTSSSCSLFSRILCSSILLCSSLQPRWWRITDKNIQSLARLTFARQRSFCRQERGAGGR